MPILAIKNRGLKPPKIEKWGIVKDCSPYL